MRSALAVHSGVRKVLKAELAVGLPLCFIQRNIFPLLQRYANQRVCQNETEGASAQVWKESKVHVKICRIHGFNLQSARCLFPSFRVQRRGGQSVVGEGVVFSDQPI